MADIELLTTRHAKEIIDNDNKNKNEIVRELLKVQDNSFIDLLFSGEIVMVKTDSSVSGKGFVLFLRVFERAGGSYKITVDDIEFRVEKDGTGGTMIPFSKSVKFNGDVAGAVILL